MADILVVDDEPDVRAMVRVALETSGHRVSIASDGAQAIRKIRRRAFDAVVLDIMMPELNGYDVLDEMRSMNSRASTPVIVITAKHDPAGLVREVAAGASDHLAKPFLPSELEAAIDRAIEASDEAEQRRRILGTDAEVYASLHELVEQARIAT